MDDQERARIALEGRPREFTIFTDVADAVLQGQAQRGRTGRRRGVPAFVERILIDGTTSLFALLRRPRWLLVSRSTCRASDAAGHVDRRSAAQEPQNWLIYSGDYFSQRYSPLNQITAGERQEPGAEVDVSGAGRSAAGRSTPLVVDGIMYVTQRPNDVVALDAKTGRVFWIYQLHTIAESEGLLRGE